MEWWGPRGNDMMWQQESKVHSKSLVRAIFLAFVLGVAFVSTPAMAQDGPAAETRYNFDDELVSGDLVRPDGEQLVVRRRGRRTSLIRIREHFVPEMLKSVEDL